MSHAPLLSVLVPALDEVRTLEATLDRILGVDLPLEVVLVDDGSSDGTWEVMARRADGVRVRSLRHPTQRGKGAAVRTALQAAVGEYVVIQDADAEYDPGDLAALLRPMLDGRADAVFGVRTLAGPGVYSFLYVVGNRALTRLTNALTGARLTDMQCGYKVLPRRVALGLDLRSHGFDIDPEITVKLLRLGQRIVEVPVAYTARSRAEGKKITARDGVRQVAALARFRRWDPRRGRLDPDGGSGEGTVDGAAGIPGVVGAPDVEARFEGRPQPAHATAGR